MSVKSFIGENTIIGAKKKGNKWERKRRGGAKKTLGRAWQRGK
jgi:hypothetical protein